MLGYTLINYGILSLHLTDITPEMHAEHPELASKTHNLHSEEFTTYIALIAVFFALLMVMIGLSNIITKKAKSENDFVTQEIETLHEDYNAKSEEEESTQGGSYG